VNNWLELSVTVAVIVELGVMACEGEPVLVCVADEVGLGLCVTLGVAKLVTVWVVPGESSVGATLRQQMPILWGSL